MTLRLPTPPPLYNAEDQRNARRLIEQAFSAFTANIVVKATGVTLGQVGTFNFTGAGVTVAVVGGVATITVSAGGGALTVQDEGATLGTATILNFVGVGVTATLGGSTATITVPGGGTGPTGPQGVQGAQGFTGNDGETGDPGVPGAAGVAGATGPQGIQGQQGFDGNDGQDGDMGLPGVPGAAGTSGAPGGAGIQGAQGFDGADGQDGDAGPPGSAGAAGAPGGQGIQGAQGFDGADGQDGDIGPPGPAGTQGTAGGVGGQGIQGAQGFDGNDGQDGDIGYPGAPGTVGTSGAPGAQGVQGPQGADGQDGDSGTIVLQGLQGATGQAGTNGAAGNPGPPGDSGQDGSNDGLVGVNSAQADAIQLLEFTTTDPPAPLRGSLLYSRLRGQRNIPTVITPLGIPYEMLSYEGLRGTALAKPFPAAATLPGGYGFNGVAIGTATIATIANTNIRTQTRRLNFASAAGAGSSAGWLNNTLMVWRGNAAKLGGFHLLARFAFLTMPATVRFFCGLSGSTAALSNADPSTQTNLVGVGFDVADANFQVLSTNNVPAATKVDTGFAQSTTELYELRVFCKANDTNVYVSLQALNAGTLFEATVTLTLPPSTQFLTPILWLNNGTTAAACAVDFVSTYLESDF